MREMAAQEVRRGLLNKMPISLRNCVNKELLMAAQSNGSSSGQSMSNSTNGGNLMLSNSANPSLLNNNGLSNNANNNNNSNNTSSSGGSNRSGNSPANLMAAASVAGNPMSFLSASSNLNASNPSAQLLAQLTCK